MQELNKSLGLPAIIAITITSMIGTGFFFGTGIGASIAGNASLIAWAILGFVTIYMAAIFGELSSIFPKAGGIYEFAKQTYGSFTSFLVGWLTWIVTNLTTAVVIVAAYNTILPPSVPFFVNLSLAIGTVILFNYIALRGTQGSSILLGIFASLSIVVILMIVIPGSFRIDFANFTPFFPSGDWSLVAVALFFIMETFMGWEAACFLAEETKNPEKTIPKGIMISAIILVILGLGVPIVMLGILNWTELVTAANPLLAVAEIIYGSKAGLIVGIGVFLTLIGSAFGGIVGSPRLLLALARDKLFLEQMSDIHPKFKTPYKAIVFQTVVSIIVLLIASGRYTTLLEMFVPMALIMYLFVIIAVPILRIKKPNLVRPFKALLGGFIPWIIALLFLTIIIAWLVTVPNSIEQFKIIISFILFGFPIYFLLLFHYDPDAIRRVNDNTSRINYIFENFLLPKGVRKHILSHFTQLQGRTILEYGSGVGTLTMHLAQSVGKTGKIIAVDMSQKNLRLLGQRCKKKKVENVQLIHDPYIMSRVSPEIKSADIIFSVGMLSYFQDIGSLLKRMKKIIPKNGGIVFVEYVDFFYIIPNLPWLSDNAKIEKKFREAGFSVRVERKRSLFWRYVFVYGINSEEDVPFI